MECKRVLHSPLQREARNQWFRGPVKAMMTHELQNAIDAHLRATGDNGKFKITVAKEGMVWTAMKKEELQHESTPIGKVLEIESLQRYILKIEKENNDDKLK